MDDQLEDKIFSQVYINSMKILSKFAVAIPPLSSWGLFRFYLCAVLLFIVLFYLQATLVWPRGVIHRITTSLGYTKKINRLQILPTNLPDRKQTWELTKEVSSVFAVQGRRLKMEDRWVYTMYCTLIFINEPYRYNYIEKSNGNDKWWWHIWLKTFFIWKTWKTIGKYSRYCVCFSNEMCNQFFHRALRNFILFWFLKCEKFFVLAFLFL